MEEIGILELACEEISQAVASSGKPVKFVMLVKHKHSTTEPDDVLCTLMVNDITTATEFRQLTASGMLDLLHHFENLIAEERLIFPERGMNTLESLLDDNYNDPLEAVEVQELLNMVVFEGSQYQAMHTEITVHGNPGYSATIEVKTIVGFIADTSAKDRQALIDQGLDIELPATDYYKMVVIASSAASTYPRLC